MTSKIREELTMGGPPPGGGVMLSPEDSEFSIEGTGTPIEGGMTTPIDGVSQASLSGSDLEARREEGPNDELEFEQDRNNPRSDAPDPEKIRLVAEINAVWKRLEALEQKRVRLREEVDELHLALSEEQRARSTAARGQRTAEEREASAIRALGAERAKLDALSAELAATRQQLAVQRWESLAKGAAAASGVLGAAVVLTRAVLGRLAT
jgi:hypothetical protein